MTRRWMARSSLLAVVATTIGCDQVTKRIASTYLMELPRQWYFGGAGPTDQDARGKQVDQAAASEWIRTLLNEAMSNRGHR